MKKNSLRAWFLAARPKTLSGAAVPVMIGASLAYADAMGNVRWLPLVLCFLFAFVMQIDANFINDYFDFIRGNDDETRLGPKRACAQGWVTTGAMKRAILLVTSVACVVGLPLVWYGGWEMILVGALCVFFCFLYTTHLSYIGLGDVLVLLFFGLVPVTLTYYLVLPAGHQHVTLECITAALACGMVIDTLLLVNNFRDIENDRKANKRTLVLTLGAGKSLLLYIIIGVAACLLGVVFLLSCHSWAFVLPLIVYLPLHVMTYVEMKRIGKGAGLNVILGKTARNIFVYGCCVSLGLLL